MKPSKTVYTCQKCGAQAPKWMGKCPDCQAWNSYVEENFEKPLLPASGGGSAPQPLAEIGDDLGRHIPTGIQELDRVLGGGYVPGSAVLIGGDPGIGKSTLLLQTLSALTQAGKNVLYVSGEESASQIKNRANRLQVVQEKLFVMTENNLETLLTLLAKKSYELVVIDSIQTLYSSALASAPGTVSQVRECSGQLIQRAKQKGITLFIIGHVTKDGAIAGPKVLEHMVDAVLYFESDRGHAFRIIRSFKNRFGPTHEIGVFEMTAGGLKEVSNPSRLFLAERSLNSAGSVVVCTLEGTRPLLLELQSLVSRSGFVNPRRTGIGVESGRLALLVAVLEKIIGVTLGDQDIFVNVAGGVQVEEPAADLGIACAIYSSFRNNAVGADTLLVGEIGLTGEVRAVQQMEVRINEAGKLGFRRVLIPFGNKKLEIKTGTIEVAPVKTLEEALHFLF